MLITLIDDLTSCLGMHLFGGKFCFKMDSREPCTCTEQMQMANMLANTHNGNVNDDDARIACDYGANAFHAASDTPSVTGTQLNHTSASGAAVVDFANDSNDSQSSVAQFAYCVCDRKNFDNFLWATITVFQVEHHYRSFLRLPLHVKINSLTAPTEPLAFYPSA